RGALPWHWSAFPLGAVAAAGLAATADAAGVERAAHDLVTDTRQVPHPAAPHEHDRVFLQVVPDARDVGRDLHPRGQPHAGHLAQRGVGLLRRVGEDPRAHAPPLGRPLKRGRLARLLLRPASFADELLDGGHADAPSCVRSRRETGRCYSPVAPPPSCSPSFSAPVSPPNDAPSTSPPPAPPAPSPSPSPPELVSRSQSAGWASEEWKGGGW